MVNFDYMVSLRDLWCVLSFQNVGKVGKKSKHNLYLSKVLKHDKKKLSSLLFKYISSYTSLSLVEVLYVINA